MLGRTRSEPGRRPSAVREGTGSSLGRGAKLSAGCAVPVFSWTVSRRWAFPPTNTRRTANRHVPKERLHVRVPKFHLRSGIITARVSILSTRRLLCEPPVGGNFRGKHTLGLCGWGRKAAWGKKPRTVRNVGELWALRDYLEVTLPGRPSRFADLHSSRCLKIPVRNCSRRDTSRHHGPAQGCVGSDAPRGALP